MTILFIALGLFILLFGFVVFFGAPYVPTLNKQQTAALDLLGLKEGQVFYDLGCGDGRLLMAAARRGLQATGYELNPLLAFIAWLRTRRYGRRVKVICGNFWKADIRSADGIFVFLIDHHMKRLDSFLKRQLSGGKVKVASFAFQIPGRQPLKTSGAVFLYRY